MLLLFALLPRSGHERDMGRETADLARTKVSIVLEELGLPYKLHAIDFKKNEQKVRRVPLLPRGEGIPLPPRLFFSFLARELVGETECAEGRAKRGQGEE